MMPESSFMPLEFLRPLWLLGLLAVFLFSLLRYKMAKKGQSQNLIAAHLSEHLVSSPSSGNTQTFTFNILAVIACIALAGPSWRNLQLPVYEMEKAQVIALDLSYSMYATDIKPNRLSQAKYKTIDLIKKLSEGEKALIAYAGDAFTISPLTADGNSIINHIPQLSPEIMPVTGARADLALEKAITLLENAGYTQGHIVFITDDIDKQTSQKMVARLKGTDWVVSILAMATEQGEPIKLSDGSLLKNQQGDIVVPKLQAQPLYAISNASHGLYLTPSNSNADIERLASLFTVKDAHKKENGQSGQNKFAIDDGYWLTFLLLPLFLLLFRKGLFYVLLLSVTMPFASPSADASIWKNGQQNAFQAYQDKDYQTAAELYDEPISKGSALYQNKQYQQALDEFTQATIDDPKSATAFYNQGNAYAQLQEFDKAIEAYQQALTIDPGFKMAQENKQLLEKIKKQQEQQQSDQQQSEQQQSEQQQSEQQQSEQQQSEQQQSEQQQSDQQQSEQQQSEQQQSEQQQSDQQQSDQQKTEQQKAEQQKAEQQKAEQQSEQQKAEQQEQSEESQQKQQAGEMQEAEQVNQELQDLPNWLKNMPDDPSLLLRNKMRLEYQKRAQSQPAKQKNNGEIW
ncbi:MAG: Ca-activated chloride channel family protein [Psychromonas sp.]|jgi:Ca-activated chloride channel family protein|uniref:VWA domain-containing protein n=1 Tax=Psychromonas sp. TaxID=1884585 RepID=UPI0039E52B10